MPEDGSLYTPYLIIESLCTFSAQTSVSKIGGGEDTTIPSPARSPKQPLPGKGLRHPHMVVKLAPNSTHLTRGLVKYIPGRGCFYAVPSQNGEKLLHPLPPSIVERVKRLIPNTYRNQPCAEFTTILNTRGGNKARQGSIKPVPCGGTNISRPTPPHDAIQ